MDNLFKSGILALIEEEKTLEKVLLEATSSSSKISSLSSFNIAKKNTDEKIASILNNIKDENELRELLGKSLKEDDQALCNMAISFYDIASKQHDFEKLKRKKDLDITCRDTLPLEEEFYKYFFDASIWYLQNNEMIEEQKKPLISLLSSDFIKSLVVRDLLTGNTEKKEFLENLNLLEGEYSNVLARETTNCFLKGTLNYAKQIEEYEKKYERVKSIGNSPAFLKIMEDVNNEIAAQKMVIELNLVATSLQMEKYEILPKEEFCYDFDSKMSERIESANKILKKYNDFNPKK